MLTIWSSSVGFIVGFVVFRWFFKRYQKSRLHAVAHQLARNKRTARDQRRDQLNTLLRTKYARHLPDCDTAQRIAQSTAVQLLQGFQQKDFTYAQVTLVLSLRAIKIGQILNCTTEEFFDQAMEEAERLDENSGSDKRLLKGIPVSIKDQIDQKGADSSMAISTRNFQPAREDGLILQLLKDQGALAGFVRTATIQGMMLPETASDTYGVANNPFNFERTTGGSSGGEGAFIAARGAPLGIGSDIGGSIRIPAHFCGVFGFKPTPNRLTNKGATVPSRRQESGQSNIHSTIGPLARCTDDLVLAMRSLLQEKVWFNHPELPRQPWREERFTDKKRLTIGYYTNDNWFSAAPACIRAVNEAADVLRKLGHTLVPYTPIDVPEAVRLYTSIIGADGNRHFLEAMENDPINPLYSPLVHASMLPNFLRPLVAFILRLVGERRNACIAKSVGSKTAYEYFELIIDMKKYIKRWLDDLRENHIDLLLTPVNGLPAYRHGQSAFLFVSCSYTFLFNLLHLPAGVVPMTVVRDDEQYYEDIGGRNNDRAVAMAKEVCRESAGLPIGVQLVGWPNDDERVLRVMKELENAIGKMPSPMPKSAADIDIYSN